MVIQLDEVRKARKREYLRAHYKSNKEKIAERGRARYEANKEKIAERGRAYREANKEKIAERDRARYEANKEKVLECRRAYYEANKEKVRERSLAYYEANKEKVKAYRETNKEKVNAQCIACAKRRYATNDTYRLAVRARGRINDAFRASDFKKSTRTIKLLGCNWETYRKWIESHFTDGMSWDNQDEWHVDHTYPVMPALQQFGEAALPVVFNYRNCKPMWAKENLSKNATIPPESEIHPWVKEKLAALVQAG